MTNFNARAALLAAAAFSLAALSGPALAKDAPTGSNTVSSNTSVETAAKPAKERRYCVKESFTGTRLVKRICKTKKEWAKDDVDVEAL